MIDRSFGDAGSRVVLEELLTGPEVSFFVVADGEHYVPLLSAQDHKRIFDDDEGPNTGGMGAFSPSPLMNDALQGADRANDRAARVEGDGCRGKSVPRISLLRLDADARRPEGDRVQRALWRPRGAGRFAACCDSLSDLLRSESDGFSRRYVDGAGSADAEASALRTSVSLSASSSPLTAIPARSEPATSFTASTTSLAIVPMCSCSTRA